MRSSWNSSRLLSLLPLFSPISCLRRVWLCWECVPDPECGAGTCTTHTLKSKEGQLSIAPATGLSQAGNYDRVAWTTGSCISLFFKYFKKFISERRETLITGENHWSAASYRPPTWNGACNLVIYLWLESNLAPFSLLADRLCTQPNWLRLPILP